ncbi:MAG TPA: MBL fold metallo-hydrolase [Candidatus Thermoplasmatota archaeon]|nr:MBL fold metallo-hydrolase [Candidatus Thermoplasmatota archaeon]
MKFQFLGGVNEVGRLGMLLDHGENRLLFDYGMAPSDPPKYPEPAPPVDAALLSHAHLDHSGMMPWVAGTHAAPIHMTRLTAEMSELLAHDSLKIARIEGYPQPFQTGDIAAMRSAHVPFDHGDERRIGDMRVRFHDAGHIPGSTMFEVSDGDTTVLFTGDLNLVDTKLCRPARPVKCDVLVMEATYAGREHTPRPVVEEQFLDAVAGVVAQGGQVVVPSFAVGRSQEMLMVLLDQGYDVWLDGMGKHVIKMMLDESRYVRDPKGLERALAATKIVRSPAARERAMEGDVIVTTSGMMEGGPVLQYAEKIRKDPRSAIFFTGFQVPGSVGRRVLDERVLAPHDRAPAKIECEIRRFDFSGHAAHSELVRFTRECDPEHVILFHSDNREPLKEALPEREVHLPVTGEVVDLR